MGACPSSAGSVIAIEAGNDSSAPPPLGEFHHKSSAALQGDAESSSGSDDFSFCCFHATAAVLPSMPPDLPSYCVANPDVTPQRVKLILTSWYDDCEHLYRAVSNSIEIL
jgi:hypothetical protein